MIAALIASTVLGLHPGDVCRLPANVALVEPGKINWLLKEPYFRLVQPTSAIVVRVNPEGVEGVAELRLYDGSRRLGWVESQNLVAVRDQIASTPRQVVVVPKPLGSPKVADGSAENLSTGLASIPIKPYGVKARRKGPRPDFSSVDAALAGMYGSMMNPSIGPGPFGGLNSGTGRTPGYYYGPRQPPGTYLGGVGSSHRGGTYFNPNTGNRYQASKSR